MLIQRVTDARSQSFDPDRSSSGHRLIFRLKTMLIQRRICGAHGRRVWKKSLPSGSTGGNTPLTDNDRGGSQWRLVCGLGIRWEQKRCYPSKNPIEIYRLDATRHRRTFTVGEIYGGKIMTAERWIRVSVGAPIRSDRQLSGLTTRGCLLAQQKHSASGVFSSTNWARLKSGLQFLAAPFNSSVLWIDRQACTQ